MPRLFKRTWLPLVVVLAAGLAASASGLAATTAPDSVIGKGTFSYGPGQNISFTLNASSNSDGSNPAGKFVQTCTGAGCPATGRYVAKVLCVNVDPGGTAPNEAYVGFETTHAPQGAANQVGQQYVLLFTDNSPDTIGFTDATMASQCSDPSNFNTSAGPAVTSGGFTVTDTDP